MLDSCKMMLLTSVIIFVLASSSLQQKPEQISRKVDLVFLLDESRSIRNANPLGTRPGSADDNWRKILNLVISIIVGNPTYSTHGLPIHPAEARVGMVTFADVGTVRWDLLQYSNKPDLIEAIEDLDYNTGATNTTGGFRVTKQEVFTPSGGDRPYVNDVIVLITDGQPTVEVPQLEGYVRQLKEVYNFRIIGIGVTATADTEKITSLVSPPTEMNYFHIDTFNNFSSIENALYNRIINYTSTAISDDRSKVHTISPLYGPIAGGTKITVQGEYLYPMEQPTLVYLYQGEEYQLCGTATRINEKYICETLPLVDELDVLIGIPQPMLMRWLNSTRATLSTNYRFTYKSNPRIENIQPLQTIVSGGVQLTVEGEDMDASPAPTIYYDVAVPTMGYNYTDAQVCTVMDHRAIHCFTTEIALPENKQLSTGEDCALDEKSLCQHELDVYIGVEFDNYKEYRDLRNRDDDLAKFKELLVFPDPVVYGTENEDTLRSWWPHSLHKISAQGENLKLDPALLNFTIGDIQCGKLEIYASELICVPTDKKPSGRGADNKYPVQVNIGALQFDVTRVGFETTVWDCKDCRVGLEFGFAVLGIVIFAVMFMIARKATISCREDA